MASFLKIQILSTNTKEEIGFVRVRKDSIQPTFCHVREQIEGDELLSGPFEFVEDDYTLTKRQEERWTINDQLVVHLKTTTCNKDRNPPPSKRQCPNVVGEVECEAQPDTSCMLRSRLLSPSILQQWQKECDRVRSKLNEMIIPRDDKFELHTEDFNGEPLIRIWCHECGVLYGKGSIEGKQAAYNCCANFMRTHILLSTKHELKYMLARGLMKEDMPKVVNQPQKDDKREIETALEKLQSIIATNEGWDFEVVEVTLHDFKDKSAVRVRCKYDDTWLRLCPPRSDLHTVLYEHSKSTAHAKALEKEEGSKALLTGSRGRPRKAKEHDPKQRSLSNYMVSTKDASASMTNISSFDSHGKGQMSLVSINLLCWGLWSDEIKVNKKYVKIKPLLDDLFGGKCWFAEPYTKALLHDGHNVFEVVGCFRHINCLRISNDGQPFEGFSCHQCKEIPRLGDFRMRVYRENKVEKKRGNRGTGGGRRLDYLTRAELRKTTFVAKKQARDILMRLWWAQSHIAILSVRVRSLREASIESLNRNDVRRFCSNVVEAHRLGKFGGKTALWDFLQDVAQNMLRPNAGQRYSENTKAIFEVAKMWGGPRLHDFLSSNLNGPSLSTTKRSHRHATQFIPGIHGYIFDALAEIYRQEKEKHGIREKIPFILVEDETAIKKRIRWNPKDDMLVGFDGYKTDNHECSSSCMIKVGVGQSGYEKIFDAFENCIIGGYARVFVANPLHDSLPRLVLVVHCTCNRFDALFVRKQWVAISTLWNEKLMPTIGPIIGHASDGDSRRRKLMLSDYVDKSGDRFQINWKGWPLSTKISSEGVLGLHDQDFIHNGKKLVNVLDKPKRQLAIGDVWITLNHVIIVYDSFPIGKHMLKEGDIRRDDRQNWAGAQRICSRHVQSCLGELANNGKRRKERGMLGTQAYLEVAGDYIDIFLSAHLSLVERVHLASKVSFFFQIWRAWIVQHSTYTLSTNFISKEAFLDVQLSCHFVVLLIKYFRDFCPSLKCPLHLTGSDAAEIFFSKIGSMVGQERSYDLMDMLHTMGILNRLAHFECKEDGLVFARAHKKQEHVWTELNFKESMPKADLGDYDCVSNDDKIIAALKKGLESAQAICEHLHMKPKEKDKENMQWWLKPWKDGFANAYAKMDKLESDSEEEDLTHASEEEDSESKASVSEIRHVVDSVLDEQEAVSPVVSIDGKCVFKSTLVSQLNGNPTLSKDRLTRVRQGVYYTKEEKPHAISNENLFGIGSDCAIFFEEDTTNKESIRKGNPSSVQMKKKPKGIWYLGRVQKMIRKSGKGYVEYKRGFNLTDRPSGVQVQLGWYQKTKGSRCFTYDLTDLQMVEIESVIALANLTYDSKSNKYELDENDLKVFNDFVKNH